MDTVAGGHSRFGEVCRQGYGGQAGCRISPIPFIL